MTAWLAAAVALLPALAVPLWFATRGRTQDRLVSVQFATTVSLLLMVFMSYAFAQPSILELPLMLAFLSLPGTLLLAIFLERWL